MASTAWTVLRSNRTLLQRGWVINSKSLSSFGVFSTSGNVDTTTTTSIAHSNFDNSLSTTNPRRMFSSVDASTTTTTTTTITTTETNNTSVGRKEVLHETLGDTFTPGQAMSVLQKKGAYGSRISRADFLKLCESARPGKISDSRVIYNALKDFRRCWGFQMVDSHLAKTVLDGMTLGCLPDILKKEDNEHYDRYMSVNKMKAAMYAGNAFVDRRTGLYYVTEVSDVEKLLTLLWEGLQTQEQLIYDKEKEAEAESKTDKLKYTDPTKQALLYLVNPNPDVLRRRIKKRTRYVLRRVFGNMSVKKEDDPTHHLSQLASSNFSLPSSHQILKLTQDIFHTLLIRDSKPERQMKKQAKRAYLQHLVVSDGPTVQTVELAMNICGMVGGIQEARSIVDLWEKQIMTRGYGNEDVRKEDRDAMWKLVEEMEQQESEDNEEESMEEESNVDAIEEEVTEDKKNN